MIEKLIAVRKHGGEKYKIFVMLPEYDGETGIFGIEEDPHIRIETPENCFGYSDTVLFDNRYGKGLHRQEIAFLHKGSSGDGAAPVQAGGQLPQSWASGLHDKACISF